MTHNDIYTKFMIEYDKANVTSSYPSLTEYEVATVLDKAYLALIAQKVTGNNPRRAPFESDVKAIADIQPLVVHKDIPMYDDAEHAPAANIAQFKLPSDCLYIVQTMLNCRIHNATDEADDSYLQEHRVYSPDGVSIQFEQIDQNQYVNWYEVYEDDPNSEYVRNGQVYGDPDNGATSNSEETSTVELAKFKGNPYDKQFFRYLPVKLVTHDIAEKFFITPYNMPWVKIPVSYVEDNIVHVVYDSIKTPNVGNGAGVHFTYVKKPNLFAKDLDDPKYASVKDSMSYFECPASANDTIKADFEFECNSTIAEEVISLAISFALENVESLRLNSKLNMRGLEA